MPAADIPPSEATPEDRARFEQMFQAHLPYVWTSLRRLGVREADREDVASEIFIRVHARLDHYDPSRPARPWLFAFCVRAAADYRRLARHKVEVFGRDQEATSFAPRPDEALERAEARSLVARAIDTLDLDRRAVFVLHDLDEVSVPEIARALGIPEGTAYTRLRAARAAFAQAAEALRREPQTRKEVRS